MFMRTRSESDTTETAETEPIAIKNLDPSLARWYFEARGLDVGSVVNSLIEVHRRAHDGKDVLFYYSTDRVVVDGLTYDKNSRINRPAFFSIEDDFVTEHTGTGYIDDENAQWDTPYVWIAKLHEVPKV